MKKAIQLIVFIIPFCLFAQSTEGGPAAASKWAWKSIGPDGGSVISLKANPLNRAELYAVTADDAGRIFRSGNSGSSWSELAIFGSPVADISIDHKNPNIIYALGIDSVFKTVNKGKSWEEYQFLDSSAHSPSSAAYESFSGSRIAVNPTNPKIVYVFGRYYESYSKSCLALARSVSGGTKWKIIKIGPTGNYVSCRDMALNLGNPNVLYVCGTVTQNSTSYKIYKSVNGGQAWSDISGDFPIYPEALITDPTNPAKVYVGTYWGVYRSSDGGQTWIKNSGTVYAYELAMDPSNPSILYAGYYGVCYKSVDGGENWFAPSQGLPIASCISLLAASNPDYVLFGSDSGLYKSSDGGQSWNKSYTGLRASSILTIDIPASAPNHIFAAVTGTGVVKSLNGGKSWEDCSGYYSCAATKKVVVNDSDSSKVYALVDG